MSALFSPDSLLGRYEGLLGERSTLKSEIKCLKAELRQARAATTMSGSSYEGRDELDVLLHSFDDSEVFVGRTESGSPSKQRGVRRGVSSSSRTQTMASASAACGTTLDSCQSGWTSVDTVMSSDTTLWEGEGTGTIDSLEGFCEKSSEKAALSKPQCGFQLGSSSSALERRVGNRQASSSDRAIGRQVDDVCLFRQTAQGNLKPGVKETLAPPEKNWSLCSVAGSLRGGIEKTTVDGDDAPSRLSVMSDGQISKLIGDWEQLSSVNDGKTSSPVGSRANPLTPAKIHAVSIERCGDSGADKAGKIFKGMSSDNRHSSGGCLSSCSSKGGDLGTSRHSRAGIKLGSTISGGVGGESSVSSLQDMGSLTSDGQVDSRTSLDLLCKEMMRGINEMKTMSEALTRRTSVLSSTQSISDLERASTLPLVSTSSALLMSTSEDIAVEEEVSSQTKKCSQLVTSDVDIPAILTREMQPFTKDPARENQHICSARNTPEPPKPTPLLVDLQERLARDRQCHTQDSSWWSGLGKSKKKPVAVSSGELCLTAFPASLTREMQPFDGRAGSIKHSPLSGNSAELLGRKTAQESRVMEEEDKYAKEFCMESIKGRLTGDNDRDYYFGEFGEEDGIRLPSSLGREMEQFHSGPDDIVNLGLLDDSVFNNDFAEENGIQIRPPRPRTPLPLQVLRSLGEAEPNSQPAGFKTFRNLCEAVYSGGRNSPSDEEIVGAVRGEVNRVLMESPELGYEGGMNDTPEIGQEAGTRSLHRTILSPVLEELSHRSNNMDSTEDPPREDCLQRCLALRSARGICSPFVDCYGDRLNDNEESWQKLHHSADTARKDASCGSGSPYQVMECCFSSSLRADGVVLTKQGTVAISYSEMSLTDYVVSKAIVSSGVVEFNISCEKLDGWAFVGIIAASEVNPVRPWSIAENPTAYGWTSGSEFFEGGNYHHDEEAGEMVAPGMTVRLTLDCSKGVLSFRVPQPLKRRDNLRFPQRRYTVYEMENLPASEWRLAIEWLGTGKFELLDLKRWS